MRKRIKAALKPDISRFALGIGLFYAVLGVLWIFASDIFVHSLSSDPGWLAAAQRYKGVFYVLSTSLALIFLVNAGYKRVFDALDRAEAMELHARDLFLQHPKPMWVYDRETRNFLAVNEAAARHYGYSREEFLTMHLQDIRHPDDLPRLNQPRQDANAGPQDIGVVRHRKKSGEIFFVHLTLHTVQFQQRAAAMVMAIDVTSEVLSKRALERQQAQFRQLHQSLSDALWIASADGRTVLYISPAAEQIYGVPVERLLADPDLWLLLVHPEDRHIASASRTTLQASGEASCEYRVLSSTGVTRWVSDRKRLVVDDEGLVTMMGGILKDITAAKEHDAQLATNQLELERQVAERTADLVRVNAELDAFARTVAHDLKSPLVSVVGFSQLLHKRYAAVLTEDGVRLTERIERSATRMACLVNDLLSLSRVSTTPLVIGDVDLVPIARDIMEELQDQEPQRQVRFDLPDVLHVRADAGLVRPLLANLLGNAWKFTGKREDAHIRLLADTQGPDGAIRLQDNGVGFDAGDAGLLFQPFQRFHTLSEFSGTGIGLTTCQRIIDRHHGSIRVESVPGEGTSVFVTFAPSPETAAAS